MENSTPYRYTTVENKNNGMDAIKLLDQPFEGIIFSYGNINIVPDEQAFGLSISFDYEILNPNHKGLSDHKPFEDYIGKLLEHILLTGMSEFQHNEGAQ